MTQPVEKMSIDGSRQSSARSLPTEGEREEGGRRRRERKRRRRGGEREKVNERRKGDEERGRKEDEDEERRRGREEIGWTGNIGRHENDKNLKLPLPLTSDPCNTMSPACRT